MKRRNFSAEFKRESAQLVLDQNYIPPVWQLKGLDVWTLCTSSDP